MKKIFLCALGLHVVMRPCLADVIPTRYAEDDAAARQAVQERLQDLGVSAASAEASVRELTYDELSYFAQETCRIQPAGSLYWYEWLLGTAMLGAAVGASVWIYMEHSEHNENEHE